MTSPRASPPPGDNFLPTHWPTTMDVANLYNGAFSGMDSRIPPYFDSAELRALREQQSLSMHHDPYPPMYLDNQSRVTAGVACQDVNDGANRQEGKYTAFALAPSSTKNSAVSAPALVPRVGARKSPVRPPPCVGKASDGTADSSSSMATKVASTRSHTRLLTRDSAETAPTEDDDEAKPASKSARTQKKKPSRASDDGDQQATGRSVALARNRVAALKCRKKKKEYVSDLEEQRIVLEQTQQRLQAEHSQLMSELTSIKNSLMDHAGCNDPNIDNWLNIEARRFIHNTKERYKRTYGDSDQLTYESLLETAAPVASALEHGAASPPGRPGSSLCGSAVSSGSTRRSSIPHSQGGVAPTTHLPVASVMPSAWVNPSELTTYSGNSALTSPSVPDFNLSLTGDDKGVGV